jgi:hypothetical protein
VRTEFSVMTGRRAYKPAMRLPPREQFLEHIKNNNVLYHSSSVIQRFCDTDTIE